MIIMLAIVIAIIIVVINNSYNSYTSPLKVYGILDPLSATAQSASAVLALFGMAFNAEVLQIVIIIIMIMIMIIIVIIILNVIMISKPIMIITTNKKAASRSPEGLPRAEPALAPQRVPAEALLPGGDPMYICVYLSI